MQAWSIKCYGGKSGPIEDWFSEQSEEVQEAFSTTLAFLRVSEDWLYDEAYTDLAERGDRCGEFGEIRFSTPLWAEAKIEAEHRAIGTLIETEREFIVLYVETKKVLSSEFSRPDSSFYDRACGKAYDRLRELERGEVAVDECSF